MNINDVFFNKKNIYICFFFIVSICYLPIYAQTFDHCIDLMTDTSKLESESDSNSDSNSHSNSNLISLNRSSFLNIHLSTKEDKMKALQLVTLDIPELFNVSSDFPIDFIELLDSNENLLSSIRKTIPQYDNIIKQRPNLLDITITTNSQEQRYLERQTNPYDFNMWIRSLKNSLYYSERYYSKFPLSEVLNKLINIYTNTLDFNSILGVLYNIIPESTAFNKTNSLSFQDRINILYHDLPLSFEDNLIKWNIIIKDQKLKEFLSTFSDKEKILFILKSQAHLFNLFSILIIQNVHKKQLNDPEDKYNIPLYALLKDTILDLESSISGANLEKMIDGFEPTDLKSLDDLSLIKQSLTTILSSEDVENISKLIVSNAKSYLSSKQLNTQEPNLSLHVKEVLPLSALFRGYIGSDCASNISFAYPNDPFERVFFIYNSKNESLGYISSTEILINGKKSLYINTISGSHLSFNYIKILLDGLNNIKKELGVETISYPIMPIIQNNINHSEIINALKSRIDTKTTIEAIEYNLISKMFSNPIQSFEYLFRYQHEEIRNFISEFKVKYNSDRYDSVSRNYRLRIDNSSKNSKLIVTVKERTMDGSIFNTSSSEFYKKIVLSLWKSIESKGFESRNLKNILSIINKDKIHTILLYEDLLNKNKLELNQYLAFIQNQYGIKLKLEDLSLETLARLSDFTTNEDIQIEFMKKIKYMNLKSIYFKDSFNIIADRIKFLSTTQSKQLTALKKDKVYKLLSNPNYVNFYKITNRLLVAVRTNNKLDIIKQGINNFVTIEELDGIEQLQNNPVFIIEKNKKFAFITEEKVNPFIKIDLEKIEPIKTNEDSTVFSKFDHMFKIYKNGKCGIINISTFKGDIYIDNLLLIKFDNIEYKVIRNGLNKILEYFELSLDNKLGIIIPNVTVDTRCIYDKIYEHPSTENFYIYLVQNNKQGLLIISSNYDRFIIKTLDPIYHRIEINDLENRVTTYTGHSFSSSFRVN